MMQYENRIGTTLGWDVVRVNQHGTLDWLGTYSTPRRARLNAEQIPGAYVLEPKPGPDGKLGTLRP